MTTPNQNWVVPCEPVERHQVVEPSLVLDHIRNHHLLMDIGVVMQSQGELLETVPALRSTGGFASVLHRGKKQCQQDRNDRDDDQQFDQREAAQPGSRRCTPEFGLGAQFHIIPRS